MQYTKILCAGMLALTIASCPVTGQNASAPPSRDLLPLQLEEQIPVPHGAGRLDHFSADVKRKRLFVCALGNNTVEVIDTFAGRVIHSIPGLNQPQAWRAVAPFVGFAFALAAGRKAHVL